MYPNNLNEALIRKIFLMSTIAFLTLLVVTIIFRQKHIHCIQAHNKFRYKLTLRLGFNSLHIQWSNCAIHYSSRGGLIYHQLAHPVRESKLAYKITVALRTIINIGYAEVSIVELFVVSCVCRPPVSCLKKGHLDDEYSLLGNDTVRINNKSHRHFQTLLWESELQPHSGGARLPEK